MKTPAKKILEYARGEEEIGWIASENCKFPFILNISSYESGKPHINVYNPDFTPKGKILIPDSPKSKDDIIPISGVFTDKEKEILVDILNSKVSTGTARWDLSQLVWDSFHGGF